MSPGSAPQTAPCRDARERHTAAQSEAGISYAQLTPEQQARLQQIGAEILAGVTADPATRDAALAHILELLASL